MAKRKNRRAATFIKTCYKTVTVEDLLSMEEHTPRQAILALSSLTAEEVKSLSTEDVLALYEIVSYLDDLNEVAAALPLDFEPVAVDVAAESFEKAELAKRAAGEIKAPYRLFIELARIYLGTERLTGAAAPVIAQGALIYEDLARLVDRFKDLSSEKPTEEENEAGIEALHSFGPYGMVESIAAKYSLRPFEIFQWSAEEVYLELTYQMAKSRYQANLRDIEKRQNQAPKK